MGGVAVELEAPAEEMVRVDVAEDHVGVGDGRLAAAAAVADRTRYGAGRARADTQGAALVDQAMLPPPAPIERIRTFESA